MSAHRVETTLTEDGRLILTDLPFQKGDAVEVIILTRQTAKTGQGRYPLRGKPVRYEAPTEPVAQEDWTALR